MHVRLLMVLLLRLLLLGELVLLGGRDARVNVAYLSIRQHVKLTAGRGHRA